MRVYETTFLLNPQVDEATLERQVNDISDLIRQGGGKILHERRLGTRRLAYDIQGLSQAYYHNLVFEGEPSVLPPIERHYRLNEAYLRHLTVQFDGDPEAVAADTQPSPIAEEVKPQPPRREINDGSPVGRRNAPEPVAETPAPEPQPETVEPSAEVSPEPVATETVDQDATGSVETDSDEQDKEL
ncbi:MAG: 30S ribosomal protein S6 [bacterium]